MADVRVHVTRAVQTVGSVTAQLFRCRGFQPVPPDADRVGTHDLAYWIIFLSLLAGWYLFAFKPQSDRLAMLEGRREMLTSHLVAEKKELARLERSIAALARNDPRAWERAARGLFGWLEPGEITDLEKWKKTCPEAHAAPSPSAPPTPLNPAVPNKPPATPQARPPAGTAPSPNPAGPTLAANPRPATASLPRPPVAARNVAAPMSARGALPRKPPSPAPELTESLSADTMRPRAGSLP